MIAGSQRLITPRADTQLIDLPQCRMIIERQYFLRSGVRTSYPVAPIAQALQTQSQYCGKENPMHTVMWTINVNEGTSRQDMLEGIKLRRRVTRA